MPSKNAISKKGFSMVGVLVAAVMTGFIAYNLVQVTTNAKKAQTGVQNSIDFDNIRLSIIQVISKKNLCGVAFWNGDNTTPAPAKFSATVSDSERAKTIKMGDSIIVQEGEKLHGGLLIEKIELLPVPLSPVLPAGPNRSKHEVTLEITAKRTTGAGVATITNKNNPIFMSIITNSTNNNIVDCYYSEDNLENLCVSMGGTYDATATPPCTIGGSSSSLSSSSTSISLPPSSLEQICLSMGGTFNISNAPPCTITGNSSSSSSTSSSTSSQASNSSSSSTGGPTLAQVCASMGGTFSTSTQKCTFSPSQQFCIDMGGTFSTSTQKCSMIGAKTTIQVSCRSNNSNCFMSCSNNCQLTITSGACSMAGGGTTANCGGCSGSGYNTSCSGSGTGYCTCIVK